VLFDSKGEELENRGGAGEKNRKEGEEKEKVLKMTSSERGHKGWGGSKMGKSG